MHSVPGADLSVCDYYEINLDQRILVESAESHLSRPCFCFRVALLTPIVE
jgi:hypothetical protein|eukprot:COSAG01_NODE_2536_length_7485_cov_13.683997_4_plen_50_part_00